MKQQLSLLFFVFFVAMGIALAQKEVSGEKDCQHCDLEKCPPAGVCHAGKVRDICGCCEVCGLEEGQLCDYSPSKDSKYWHGYCGFNMECQKRKDIDTKKLDSQSVCVCETKGLVCGSDGVTYSPCQMIAAQSKLNATKKHDGPCQTRPQIITISESQNVLQGTKHTIICEVQGFPLPNVQWYFTVPGSKEPHALPGDSEEISVSVRGGPEKMRITTFLQITDFQLKHEGNYECMASGVDGLASKKLSLVFQRNSSHDL